MRKINAVAEFDAERRRFLLRSFRETLSRQSVIDMNSAFRTAAAAPPPRFWVSETRAAAIVGRMLAGKNPLEGMHPERREMYREIFARFMRLRAERRDASIAELTAEIVNGPAPRSYLSSETVRSVIYKEKQRLRRERGQS